MTQATPTPDYYLNYFLKMIDVVYDRYEDILSTEDRIFIESIRKSSKESIRLLIRLYLRKGPNFLAEKLDYIEVPLIKSALAELNDRELIDENPLVYGYELVELLPVKQSREIFSEDPKCRKADLVEAWLDDDTLLTCTEWGVNDPIITPLHYENYRRLQLLYFGNERQDLTEFILEDLGLFKYEKYNLSKSTRRFNHEDDIDSLIQINDLNTEFFLLNESKDWPLLPELAQRVFSLTPPEHLHTRWHRLLNRIAYRLEQLEELDIALTFFETNTQPPSRERQARIHFKKEEYNGSLSILNDIQANPFSSGETQFYSRFINKVLKKLDLEKRVIKKPVISEIHHEWKKGEGTVEQQACEHFKHAVWYENSLPLGVFGLIYWPAIFADVPGVWHHPFQAAPTDMYDIEFTEKRKKEIAEINELSKEEWRKFIICTFELKQNIRNPFVNWSVITLEWVLNCFDSLSQEQWQGLFNHLLSDIRQYQSGFPDLFQKTDCDYRFIEIKGPGDKLQDNQIEWLGVFERLQIKADVCYVSYL